MVVVVDVDLDGDGGVDLVGGGVDRRVRCCDLTSISGSPPSRAEPSSDPDVLVYRLDDARRSMLGPATALLINTQEQWSSAYRRRGMLQGVATHVFRVEF